MYMHAHAFQWRQTGWHSWLLACKPRGLSLLLLCWNLTLAHHSWFLIHPLWSFHFRSLAKSREKALTVERWTCTCLASCWALVTQLFTLHRNLSDGRHCPIMSHSSIPSKDPPLSSKKPLVKKQRILSKILDLENQFKNHFSTPQVHSGRRCRPAGGAATSAGDPRAYRQHCEDSGLQGTQWCRRGELKEVFFFAKQGLAFDMLDKTSIQPSFFSPVANAEKNRGCLTSWPKRRFKWVN